MLTFRILLAKFYKCENEGLDTLHGVSHGSREKTQGGFGKCLPVAPLPLKHTPGNNCFAFRSESSFSFCFQLSMHSCHDISVHCSLPLGAWFQFSLLLLCIWATAASGHRGGMEGDSEAGSETFAAPSAELLASLQNRFDNFAQGLPVQATCDPGADEGSAEETPSRNKFRRRWSRPSQNPFPSSNPGLASSPGKSSWEVICIANDEDEHRPTPGQGISGSSTQLQLMCPGSTRPRPSLRHLSKASPWSPPPVCFRYNSPFRLGCPGRYLGPQSQARWHAFHHRGPVLSFGRLNIATSLRLGGLSLCPASKQRRHTRPIRRIPAR